MSGKSENGISVVATGDSLIWADQSLRKNISVLSGQTLHGMYRLSSFADNSFTITELHRTVHNLVHNFTHDMTRMEIVICIS
jgi:hypothetical protein